MAQNYSEEEIQKAHDVLYNEGLKMRYKVAGKEYVDRALKAGDNSFARAMQEYVTSSCWGSIWTRPGLPLHQRSLLNIAMLCALNRSNELGVHVRGALNNGCTEEEIRETILQAACYCGMPAGVEGFKVAGRVLEEWKAEEGNVIGAGRQEEGGAKGKGGAGAKDPRVRGLGEEDSGNVSEASMRRHEDIGVDVRASMEQI